MKTLLLIFLSIKAFAETTILELGQSKTYSGSAAPVWVEKSAILKADAVGGAIRLTAKKVGSSKIRINNTSETIEVLHPDQLALYEKMKKLMTTKPGLRADVEDGEVVVKGYMHDWATWKSIAQNLDFSNYKMKAELSPTLKSTMQKIFDEELRSQGLLSVNVVQQPNLEVRMNPLQASLDRYRDYFQKLGISVVVAAESLELVPVVRVDITVVEMSRNASRDFGMKWPEKASFEILPEGLVTSESLIAQLNLMESRGDAKMLASPNLICRSGKEAEFFAGGEIPITLTSFRSQEVVWKKHGVMLKIKPVADSTGRISLSIDTEVSSLGSLKNAIPSIETNRVSSHFDLSHSQVIALSGLLRESEHNGSDGLPFLTQVPILGPLFASQSYIKHKTELVIFVRPRLMDQEPLEEWTKGASHATTSL